VTFTAPVTGIIKWFNSERGFGFIQPDVGGGGGSNSAADVFYHIRSVQDKQEPIEGEHCSYVLTTNERNHRVEATHVVLTDRTRSNSGPPARYGS
jgi:CspA family cold shock protein